MTSPTDRKFDLIPRPSAARDYQRVALAIDYLQRHASAQPNLDTVAKHVHLSKYHFQRLFTRWAGVSPKRFAQSLTVEYAKARLAQGSNVLDLAHDVGVSSPGRLHDLFVTIEGLSPGEFKAGGKNLSIRYGVHESPFGYCVIATTDRGICGLQFLEDSHNPDPVALLKESWPFADMMLDSAGTACLVQQIFRPLASEPLRPLGLLVKGTNFQLQVWRALLKVPFGSVTSYRRIAANIGKATAARAVAHAIACNPIAFLIPCHRVIRETGVLTEYRWGRPRKAAIQGWEAASCSVPSNADI